MARLFFLAILAAPRMPIERGSSTLVEVDMVFLKPIIHNRTWRYRLEFHIKFGGTAVPMWQFIKKLFESECVSSSDKNIYLETCFLCHGMAYGVNVGGEKV